MPISSSRRWGQSMIDYPILVARWDAEHPADLAICEQCGAESTVDPAEGDPYDMCKKCECGGQIHMKFLEVGECRNCGLLGGTHIEGCCSKRCTYQIDYAAALAAKGATT